MAVGADYSLKAGPAGGAKAAGPLDGKTPSFGPRPAGFADTALQDMANNEFASAAGAGRAAVQSMDRAGVSRGRGHQMRADMAQAAADAGAAQKTSQAELGASQADQRANLAYEGAMRGEALGNQNLLEGLRSNQASERLAARGWGQNMKEAAARGRFGLDSIQLDYTPLLANLLQDKV